MEEERQHYQILIILILINVSLLLIKHLPNVLAWNTESSDFIWDILGLIWPIMGISIAGEFLLKDKWGWGGILFHIFTLYCGIYYSILVIQSLISFQLDIAFILSFMIQLSIGLVGWITFLYYYD
jgi:hypothetical protein